jgi:pyrroline-5-carboxylate reductase
MATSLAPLAVIGTGKMGGAIVDGVTQLDTTVPSLRVTCQSEPSAKLLRDRGLNAVSLESDQAANVWAVQDAAIVILGVKPARLAEVLADISPHLQPHATVVSVAAGITIAQMEALTRNGVVRAMPNTPSQIGQGVTGLSAGSRVSHEQLAEVEKVFRLVGSVVVVEEEQMNALSALSGSGPAYLFYVAEKLSDVAASHGFTADQARTMVQGTLLGAAALLDKSGDSPENLRKAVTSPGGTTEQAIAVFDRHNLGEIFSEAVDQAIKKAIDIGRS